MEASPNVFKALAIGCIVFGLVGVVFNSLVLTVVLQVRSMQTVTNYLLANVALADLLTLIWPFYIRYLLEPPIDNATGNFLCKFIENFPLVTMSVSALTLAILAVERYQGLVKAMSSKFKLTKTSALYAIIIVWVVAFILLIPFFLFTSFNKEKAKCRYGTSDTVRAVVVVVFAIVTIVTPCVTIAFCYFGIIKGIYFSNKILGACAANEVAQVQDARVKKKLATTLAVVTAVFIVCHAPYTVSLMIFVIDTDNGVYNVGLLKAVTVFVVYGNSMLNPFLYALRSVNYMEGIKKICRCGNRNEQEHENAGHNESSNV